MWPERRGQERAAQDEIRKVGRDRSSRPDGRVRKAGVQGSHRKHI